MRVPANPRWWPAGARPPIDHLLFSATETFTKRIKSTPHKLELEPSDPELEELSVLEVVSPEESVVVVVVVVSVVVVPPPLDSVV